jgi:hypothetical protein
MQLVSLERGDQPLIVDLEIPVHATVRHHRARKTEDVAYRVVRPFAVRELTDAEAPVVVKSTDPENLFRAKRTPWRFHDGAYWKEGVPADEIADELRKTFANVMETRRRKLVVGALPSARTTSSIDRIAEVESTDEQETAAILQRHVDYTYAMMGGKLYVRTLPPVLTIEALQGSPGLSPYADGLPKCLWDIDATLLAAHFKGRSAASLASAIPEILRPDLLAFDRTERLVRYIAFTMINARTTAPLKGARDPLGASEKLRRLLRGNTSTADLMVAMKALAVAAQREGFWNSGFPASSWNRIDKLIPAAPAARHTIDVAGTASGGRLHVSMEQAGSDAVSVVLAVRNVDPEELPVVAIASEDGKFRFDIRHDGSDFYVPLSDARGPAHGNVRSDAAPSTSTRNLTTNALNNALAWHETSLGGNTTAERATRIADFVTANFVSMEGKVYCRVGEPIFVVGGTDFGHRYTRPGNESRMIRDAVQRMRTAENDINIVVGSHLIPCSVLDADMMHAASSLSGTYYASKTYRGSCEVLDPSVFRLKTAHILAAFAASRLMTSIRSDALPAPMQKAYDAAAEAAVEAIESDATTYGAGRGNHLAATIARIVEMVDASESLSPLRDDPAFLPLKDILVPRLSDEASPTETFGEIEMQEAEDDSPYYGLTL